MDLAKAGGAAWRKRQGVRNALQDCTNFQRRPAQQGRDLGNMAAHCYVCHSQVQTSCA